VSAPPDRSRCVESRERLLEPRVVTQRIPRRVDVEQGDRCLPTSGYTETMGALLADARGQAFIDRRTVVPGGPPPHYALWVSLWRHNPAGMFAPFNPNVTCEFATSTIAE